MLVIEEVVQAFVTGLLAGSVYGLMCVGLGLIFGVMRVINFAQGDFLMLGMYATLYISAALGMPVLFGAEVTPFVSAVLAGPVLFVFGYLIHQQLFARVTHGPQQENGDGAQHAQLILTLGIALVLQNGGLLVFGSEPKSVGTSLSSSAWIFETSVLPDMQIFVNQARFLAAALATFLAYGIFLLINRTQIGKSLRAAADNPEAATYMGIDVQLAHRIAFAVGVGTTAVAGGLVATYSSFQPYVGLEYVIIMYTGVVLGGMGSLQGAFWGGMLIGLVQQLSILVLPAQLQNSAIFVVFLLVLLFMPNGLFGQNSERT